MEYKIINQKTVSIVAINGDITRHDKTILEKCYKEVSELIEAKLLIILFKNVSLIEPITFRDLTMIQHDARKKNMDLRVVGLNVSVKNTLSSGGVIRLAELKNSLDEALAA